MGRKRVVVTDHNFPNVDHERAAAERCGAVFEVYQCRTAAEVAEAVAGAAVAVVQFAPMGEDAIQRLSPGAGLIRYGIGFENIDVAAAARRSIPVGYVPDYCIDEVADHAAALALSGLRRIPSLDRSVREGRWDGAAVIGALPALRDLTIGFLGLGRIGRAVLSRLRPFGFRVIAADPTLDSDHGDSIGVNQVDIAQLFRSVDVLLLHAPVNEATTRIVNARTLETMKPNALIVNTSRGRLIDEPALAAALKAGVIGGAMLDVFEQEPLPMESPLRDAPNLILSPHAAWYSSTAIERLQKYVAEDIDRFLSDQGPRCPVPGSI